MTYDKSYHHREEIKYNRSEWCSGRAQAFKTIGHGFAPRQRFVFFTRPRRRRVSIYQSYIGGLPPASAFSFSHVDVGDAFQFINHISANPYRPAVSCPLSGLYDLQIEMCRLRRRVKKKTKRLWGANPRPMDKGYDRQHIPLCNQSYTCWFQAQRLPYKLE